MLYRSGQWKSLRNHLIIRDGNDMAMEGYELGRRWILHHINPITKEDILKRSSSLFDPENLICVSYRTHEAIHFGDETLLNVITVRSKNDTCPWKQ